MIILVTIKYCASLYCKLGSIQGFPGGSVVKNLPTMWETQVLSVCLEKALANHASILAWRIPWTEEHGGLQWDCKEQDTCILYIRQLRALTPSLSFFRLHTRFYILIISHFILTKKTN